MSLKLYTEPFKNGNTGYGASGQIFGEYILKLAVRRQGNGKVVVRDVPFGMCGDASAAFADLDEAAYRLAEKIAKLSEGVIMGFFKKVGKYRNDEVPKKVHDLRKQYGTIIMSNNPLAEDPDALGPYPLKTVTSKVFIPWLRDDTSRQDMVATLKEPVDVNGNSFYFGYSRFADGDKTMIEVFPMLYNAGCSVKEYNRVMSFELVNDDTSVGGADGILSEAHATITSGIDDQENG